MSAYKKENLLGYLTIQVHDPDGRRRFYRKYRSRSFVKNFLQMCGGFWSGGRVVSGLDWRIRDTGGTFRASTSTANNSGNAQTQSMQIEIGSGSTNPTVDDFDIETTLAGPTNCDSVTDDSSGDDIEYRFRITITNNSGGAWTVREVTLHTQITYPTTTEYDVIIMRDELGSPVTVNDGQAITIDYSLRTTV